MTKSTITRERLELIANFHRAMVLPPSHDEIEELARIALAAMDSEPVAEVVSIYGDPEAFGEREIRPLVGIQQMPYGTKLYRHAQPAPVVSADLFHTASSAIEDLLTTKDRTGACVWFDLPFRLRSAANAQPVPVVPDAYVRDERGRMILNGVCEPKIGFSTGWNACRAAMLQASNSPAQSDCCPAQNHVSPEQNSVSSAQSPIDHGYRPECECSGCKATARICAELSANSTANPDCWCRTCRPVTLNDMRFVVCPDCGNKRCPRANDHRNSCTGSNEPGQEGSAYQDTPREVKGE
ncbi:TPA: hypothetical protein ACQ8KF_001043 [Klebsiella pneumoniae]